MKLCFMILMLCPFLHASYTAQELSNDCTISNSDERLKDTHSALSTGICVGFLTDWLQMTYAGAVRGDKVASEVVIEDGVDVGQLMRVFIAYMAKHPEIENKPASIAILASVAEAGLAKIKDVPCAPKKSHK